jgi:hypothetical protein
MVLGRDPGKKNKPRSQLKSKNLAPINKIHESREETEEQFLSKVCLPTTKKKQ